MGVMDWLGFGKAAEKPAASELTVTNLAERYDLLDVGVSEMGDPFVIVTEKKFRDVADTREIGTSRPSPFTSDIRKEYNRRLQGLNGLREYDKMRKSSGVVRGTLRTIKTPVLAGRWFMKPADSSTLSKNKAQFAQDCLFKYMSISWPQILTEALLMCDFGYYMFEKVWEPRIIDGKERIVLKKLAPRHPMDVKEWKYDAEGGPAGVVMNMPMEEGYGFVEKYIPISKLLVFTFDREAGNIEGISALRSAYKHWFFVETLSKIDAIQKERHGIGIPVIKLPPGYSPEDKTAAEELGANLRTNERAHVILPPMWDLLFAKLEGNPVDALASMEYHDARIRENVLASFQDSKTSTNEEDLTLFAKSTRFIADIVCEVFNLHLIPELMSYNFDRGDDPVLMVRRIGEQQDWRTLSFALRNLVGAKLITPDQVLENYLREEMDLPLADPETSRAVASPQAPGGSAANGDSNNAPEGQKQSGQQAGLPRQSPTPPVGVPAANAGTDRSGSK